MSQLEDAMDVWIYESQYFGQETEVYASAKFAMECTPESFGIDWRKQDDGNWIGHIKGRFAPVARLTRFAVLGG